ncbi:MAG: Uma2 family endonuclease, partial [Rudanella sp.]|nr:Uma2 family endonuclease [Rudanella sp.]
MQTLLESKPATHDYGTPLYAGCRMEKDDFLRWESDDNYVYEFNDGILESTIGMRQNESYLFTNLENQFIRTAIFQNGGRLRAELEIWLTPKQMRRPDVSFFTSDQIQQMHTGTAVVSNFVVEFGSESDSELKSITKRHEYFDAGVQVVWWVFPTYKEVFVYTSPKTVTICTD